LANKTCRICGDKAIGYNFDVVTCESCKAFFRRNAMKPNSFRYLFILLFIYLYLFHSVAHLTTIVQLQRCHDDFVKSVD
jgi:hypothetical protein